MRGLRREHVALGAGLLLATVVAVVLLVGRDDEQPSPSAHPPPPPTEPAPPTSPPPPPPAPRHRVAVRDGRLVVDGKPFFPIFSWGECTDGFETSLPVGTNLYAANRCGGLEAQLSTLGDRALSAAVAGEAIPDPGAVVGVFYPDEPDGAGADGEDHAHDRSEPRRALPDAHQPLLLGRRAARAGSRHLPGPDREGGHDRLRPLSAAELVPPGAARRRVLLAARARRAGAGQADVPVDRGCGDDVPARRADRRHAGHCAGGVVARDRGRRERAWVLPAGGVDRATSARRSRR